jgi:S-adenosylmethionine decarboxylase
MDARPSCREWMRDFPEASEHMIVGTEWLVDAEGCRPEALSDVTTVLATCEKILKDLRLKTVGDGLWHQFPPPSGVTAMYLLTESHLTCHTYPEYGTATFSLSCCRPRPRWDWENQLRSFLGASRVSVRCVTRGFVEQPQPATAAV